MGAWATVDYSIPLSSVREVGDLSWLGADDEDDEEGGGDDDEEGGGGEGGEEGLMGAAELVLVANCSWFPKRLTRSWLETD